MKRKQHSKHLPTYAWTAAIVMLFLGGLALDSRPLQAVAVPSDDPSQDTRDQFSSQLQNNQLVNTISAPGNNALVGTPAAYPNFPHIGLYGAYSSSGWPLVGLPGSTSAGPNDPLNSVYMDEYARYQYLILAGMPGADLRPDILTGLRSRNPNIIIYAYTMASTTWCPGDSNNNIGYPANTYYHDYYLAVTGGDPSCATTTNRFLWMQDGTRADQPPSNFGITANLAHKDGNGNYDVATDIANTIYAYGKASKNWDGIFIDVYCQGLAWMESPGHYFDYARAGYGNDNTDPANRTAFHQGWNDAALFMASHLRALATADGHPDYPITGNCGNASADNWGTLNGWMRENFPFQQGGTWQTNMLAWPYGYLHQNVHFRAPQVNYVNTQPQITGLGSNPQDPSSIYNPYTTANQHYMRFGLASATLGNGLAHFDTNDLSAGNGNWANWWFDEYGVNTFVPQADQNYGHSALGQQYTGWLGQPTTTAYSMLSSNFNGVSDLLTTNQGFETAGSSQSQLVGWINPAFMNTHATSDRTTTTAGAGTASAHVNVTAIENPAIFWSTYLGTGNFPITANTTYSVTFKAKASGQLPVTVAVGNVIQTIPVDTEWRQYQAVLTPTSNVAAGINVAFDLGLSTGEYWIDDVSVKVGTLSLWRRDFDKGSVFVNPAGATVTAQLATPMKKINGTVNPTVNDGSLVNSVTLNGTNTGTGIGDAIFLLSVDSTPPAAVMDLSAH